MDFFENTRILYFDGCQFINIKKPPIIYLLSCNTPIGESVDLISKKFVQKIGTSRVLFITLENQKISIYERANLFRLTIKIPDSPFDDFLFPSPLQHFFSIFFSVGRKVGEAGSDAEELLKLGMVFPCLLL